MKRLLFLKWFWEVSKIDNFWKFSRVSTGKAKTFYYTFLGPRRVLEDRIFFATVLSHSTVAKKFGKISCQIPEPLGCTVHGQQILTCNSSKYLFLSSLSPADLKEKYWINVKVMIWQQFRDMKWRCNMWMLNSIIKKNILLIHNSEVLIIRN